MSNDGQPPSASASSFSKSHSVHSSRAATSTVKTYINTAPPWAREEPPSPGEHEPHEGARHFPDFRRPSDVASLQSSAPEDPGPSRWWAFARHRPMDSGSMPLSPTEQEQQRPPRRPRDGGRSMSIPWFSSSQFRRSQEHEEGSPTLRESDREGSESGTPQANPRSRLRIDMPPTSGPFTLSHSRTPGWDTPWTSSHPIGTDESHDPHALDTGSLHDDEKATPWQRRRKRFRAYMMYNVYVPLLFRLCNIVLTTAALAIAIRIRIIEERSGVMGALGASPTLVIIFACLTLVHVMIAVYLEYFGRPLGLWHTSWKLAYTLLEVVFICTWSAALALSFDNFFTSLIPCASETSISWYSKLPRPVLPNGVNGFEGGVGDTLCDDQVVLICLVGVGLMMYCFNLFISLFRIFEKVKYHPTSVLTA
ncbi:uncharacterized protein TRAVEDRAFT_158679 [Trametes versicolor FP-101664 SS1]|uniref:uncharacterized protein n=1 Tax=Trametes versicolor (strain FP-101664) TaxID=717944 RepID=UPI000462178D|nr:uncharacterized protein TRAVEDRAFT_158679 [Trametes versicolor FP-101664 SS1]EIW64429.1 hypothetical protein TRAVEDRAFT_158679 [Trametes versicolor FP-101664 SS1]